MDSWCLAGSAGALGTREAPAQGCVLPPLNDQDRTGWFPGEVTHPKIQALHDISVLLAKCKWNSAAKKDSSQNSCLDPTACRKLFLLNFPMHAQKTFHWGNTHTSLEQRQGSASQLQLSSLTLFPLASPLTP